MKMRRIFAGMAASAIAFSALAISVAAEEIKYYVWGGGQVGWVMDLDNDDTNNGDGAPEGNQFPGYGKDGYEQYWVGDLDTSEGTATLKIPVVKGAKVDFIAGGWNTYDGDQYTVTIGDWTGTVKWIPIEGDADHSDVSCTYTVEDDITELTAEVYYMDPVDDGDTFGFNDYCQNFVHVHLPGGDDASETESTAEPESTAEAESTAETESTAESTAEAESTAAETTSKAAETTSTAAATTTSKATTNPATTTSTANPAASSDNKGTGAAAGIALAGVAVAGAAIVITKKRK